MSEDRLSTSLTMSADDLREHERVIERGKQTFIEVGQALLAIRDGRGYRTAGFATFERYCQDRWGWQRTNAYYYIEAAQAALNVQSIEQTQPPGFTQAIQLARLAPEVQREVASVVDFEQTPVRELRQIVDQRLGKAAGAVTPPPREQQPAPIPFPPNRERVQAAVDVLNGMQWHQPEMPSVPDPGSTLEQVMSVVGDPGGKIANSELRLAFHTATQQVRHNLLPLNVEKAVETLSLDDRERAHWFVLDVRAWLTRLETALPTNLRLVTAQEGDRPE